MTAAFGPRYVQAARSVTRAGFIGLGASIPISAGLDNALLGLILVSWLVAGRWNETASVVAFNPLAAFACVWFLVHVAAAAYSIGDMHDIARSVRKASLFLVVPIALTVMVDPRDRTRALWAFLAAIMLTVVLSTLRWAGFIQPDVPWLNAAHFSSSVVFKYHLTQNLLVAFGALVFAVYARTVSSRRLRYLFAAGAALCAINVDFIGDGRGGQLVLFTLFVFYGAWWAGRRGATIGFVAALALALIAYFTPGSSLHKRGTLALDETAEWQAGERKRGSSMGQRLEFYENSLGIIAKHPVAGVGSGGFPEAYEQEVKASGLPTTRNPHNEYLLKAVELGIPGLCLIIALFWLPWRVSRSVPTHERAIVRAAVITIAIASAVSSTLSDHTEGLLFVWAIGMLCAGYQPKRT